MFDVGYIARRGVEDQILDEYCTLLSYHSDFDGGKHAGTTDDQQSCQWLLDASAEDLT